MYLRVLSRATITNCTSSGNERDGIETQAVHVLKVDNCTLSNNGRMGAVAEQRVDNNTDGPVQVQFTNNTAFSNGSGGLGVETAAGLKPVYGYIHGNDVENCGNNQWGAGWGVVLGYNSYGEMSANTIRNFSTAGGTSGYRSAIVAGQNSGPVTISGNTVAGAGESGVNINGYGAATTLSGNQLSGASQNAIDIYNSPSSSITNNTINNNGGAGVSLALSANSQITNNIFYANAKPILITSSPNTVSSPNTYQ